MATTPLVCNIAPVIQVNQPVTSSIPAIPTPGPDISSILATLNALKLAVEKLSGQSPGPNSWYGAGNALTPASSAGGGPSSGSKAQQQQQQTQNNANKPQGAKGRWTEISRQTATVRVTNPNDNTQYVDVLRINQLVFQDSVTGEVWTWNR